MMPRPRSAARRGSRRLALRPGKDAAEFQTEEEALGALVEMVEGIPPDHADAVAHDTIEPPAKKLRTTQNNKPICVLKEQLLVPASEAALAPRSTVITRRNVGTHLGVRFKHPLTHNRLIRGTSPLESFGWQLTLFARKGAPRQGFHFDCTIDEDSLSSNQAAALVVAAEQGVNPGDHGCLWASINICIRQDGTVVALELGFEVNWNESQSVWGNSQLNPQQTIRNAFLTCWKNHLHVPVQTSASPQDFYEATFVPDKDRFDAEVLELKVPNLQANLYPFQRRAVQWLLQREGVQWYQAAGDGMGALRPYSRPSGITPISFTEVTDADGGKFYLSPSFGVATRDVSLFLSIENLRGGILAEEMGLGKTLEIIALILLHQRPDGPEVVPDGFLRKDLLTTPATLVVTPSTLLEQWLEEFSQHAPSLKILHYPGLRKAAKGQDGVEYSAEYLAAHDVVITTYDVLRAEIWLAEDEPERTMRNARQYERVVSPLVALSWWRVCIDEAQMVENWTSNAAKLARKVSRVNAWAITGTPVKDDIQKDLRGLLNFLRHEPYVSDSKIWNTFTTKDNESFRRLINLISMRHTKSLVRSEISIPPQKRYVITMPFSAVEEQYYQGYFEEMAMSCGLDMQGNPLRDGWNPEDPATQSAMRTALDLLRQATLHPEVGNRNRRMLGHKSGPMRTVAEVLDAMLEQSDGARRADQRNLLSLSLTKGQILAGLKRVEEALAAWKDVRERSTVIVSESRAQLEKEIQEARAAAPDTEEDNPEGRENMKVGEARRRLRSALEIQHRAVFFCANAYFTIKSNAETTAPDSDEFKKLEKMEVEGYDLAKSIRKEILQEGHGKAKALMGRLTKAADEQSFAVIPETKSIHQQGIESRRIVESLEELFEALDRQANQLDDWREHVIQLLLKPLVDEENEEVTGEEYEESTKLQDEILVYLQVLRASIADRQAAITGQKNYLVQHETKTATRLARAGDGPSPEQLLELFQVRAEVQPPFVETDPLTSLRGVVSELRGLSTKLGNDAAGGSTRAANELAIVNNLIKLTQAQLTEQSKAAIAMEQEVERFTDTLNARLDFYRQLQAVSDMVGEYEGNVTDATLEATVKQEETLKTRLATAESKHRYLVHLKEAESSPDEQRMCVICQSPFSIGVLTVCGHQFCKDCITLWFRAHRNCPVCKRHLIAADLHDITLKPQELKVHSEGSQGGGDAPNNSQTAPSKKVSTIYSEFNPEKLAEIKDIDLPGPNFTTKVDTLVRHLLWLRESDPGAKSIVFSQYKGFLGVLGLAFKRYRIGYTSFDRPNGITDFKEDAGIEVFLLSARAHASGLNLVNASHVFLCEPLLNTALELQAIARVDRIGQQQETTVWLYLVDGTVEESIYNLSVQRRMEHMGRTAKGKSKESTPELADASLDAANSLEMQQAHLSKLMGRDGISGEVVDTKDLWTCMFGHVKARNDGEQRLVNNPATRGFLAAEAAERRAGDWEGVEAM